jgi:calcineurin-like phosphoesterase family protein/2'-5' RNA ligase
MAKFLIEFRLHGYAKEYAKWARALTLREARRLGVRRLREPRFVPHITLFGGAEAHNFQNVIREVERVGRKYTLVPFKLGIRRGEFQMEDANWLYLDIQPSPELEQFRYDLAQGLLRRGTVIYDTCPPYDRKPKYKFHCSIGKYDPRDNAKFEKLAEYAETKCSLETFKQRHISLFGKLVNIIEKNIFRAEAEYPGISQHLLRVTILGGRSRIQSEYDLILERMLPRRRALSEYWWRKTIEKLRELRSAPPEEHLSIPNKSVYFIGDTHFDHKNIIRYCQRPFSNVTEMNQTIENNWNSTVGDNEIVYFLGDWSFGRGSKPATYWKRRMKGSIFSIQGSHDKVKFEKSRVLHVGGYSFLLIHNPEDRKIEWHDWIIHGHVHNNKMDKYPFINGERKTINVSAEVINYKPVSLEYLLSLGLDSIKRMRTIDSQPERW